MVISIIIKSTIFRGGRNIDNKKHQFYIKTVIKYHIFLGYTKLN